jgi:hypothetical protein
MRLSRILAWAVVACVVLIIAVSVTNEPPAPFVRTEDFRVSPTYITRIECVDGCELQTYAREGEGELPPVLTNRPCEVAR